MTLQFSRRNFGIWKIIFIFISKKYLIFVFCEIFFFLTEKYIDYTISAISCQSVLLTADMNLTHNI